MKINTKILKTEIEKILNEDGLSPEELANKAGVAVGTIYRILSLDRPTSQRAIARKIAEGANRKTTFEGDKVTFFKNETPSSNLYKPIPLTEKDEAVIKMLGLTPDMVRRLQYIPLLREVPTTRQNLKQQFVNLRIGTVMTTYTGENEMLFAVEMQDDSMGDVVKKGSSVVADPDQTLKEGDISAVKYNDKNYVGYYHEQNDMIILHGIGKTPPLLIPKDPEVAIFRVVQSINTY